VPALTRLIDVLEESGDLDRKTEGLARLTTMPAAPPAAPG
jgi:hypothetical protein